MAVQKQDRYTYELRKMTNCILYEIFDAKVSDVVATVYDAAFVIRLTGLLNDQEQGKRR